MVTLAQRCGELLHKPDAAIRFYRNNVLVFETLKGGRKVVRPHVFTCFTEFAELTRSFVALAAGDASESFRLHRIGWLMALAVVLQVPYRAWGLYELRRGVIADRAWPTWFGNVLIAALILNWLAGLML